MLWKLPVFGRISKIAITPPTPAPDRHGVGIAVILRNEAAHVGEWAAFHHAAGVRRFLVYDNGSRDGTLAALARALPPRALAVVPWDQVFRDARMHREIHNQVLAYAHAARNFGAGLRWLAFVDVDEFLVPTSAASIGEALEPLGSARNVSLPWHMFGRSGHATPPPGGILANYTRRAADPMSDVRGIRAFKCVVDPCRLTALRVHSMETDGAEATVNDRGDPAATARDREARSFYSAARLQLNHYYTRSEAELAAKIGRGPNLRDKAGDYERKVRRTVANIEAEEIEDRTALDFCARIGWAWAG